MTESKKYIVNLFSTQCIGQNNYAPRFEGRYVFTSLHKALDYCEESTKRLKLVDWSKGIPAECSRIMSNVLEVNNGKIAKIVRK